MPTVYDLGNLKTLPGLTLTYGSARPHAVTGARHRQPLYLMPERQHGALERAQHRLHVLQQTGSRLPVARVAVPGFEYGPDQARFKQTTHRRTVHYIAGAMK